MAVLKAGYDGRRQDEHSTSFIIKHVRRGILRSYLLRNQQLPDRLLDERTFDEDSIELESDVIDVRILTLRYAYTRLKQGICPVQAEQLNNEAKEIDRSLQDLANQLQKSCSYQHHVVVSCSPFSRRHFLSPIVYKYQKAEYAAMWAQHFATRVLINKLRLRILDLCYYDPMHKQQQDDGNTIITTPGESLAFTIPFCLERFSFDIGKPDSIMLDADTSITPYLINFIVWPLTIAAGLEGINTRRLCWFKSELAALGILIGDRAIESVETSGWSII